MSEPDSLDPFTISTPPVRLPQDVHDWGTEVGLRKTLLRRCHHEINERSGRPYAPRRRFGWTADLIVFKAFEVAPS